MSANDHFQQHPSLTYSTPMTDVSGPINYVNFKAESQGAYNAGSNINFQLQSNNEFIDLYRSYLRFKIVETGTAPGSGTTRYSYVGASACIQSISESLSGTQMPIMNDWNLHNACKLNTDELTRKQITAVNEGFTNNVAGAASVVGTSTSVCIPLPPTLKVNRYLPLCILQSLRISYTLAAYQTVFQQCNSGNSYQVTEMEIIGCMIAPPTELLQQYKADLQNGRVLDMPISLTKTIPTVLQPSTIQSSKIGCGFLTSLDSITACYRKVSDVTTPGTTTTAHDFAYTRADTLSNYYILLNSQRYPRNSAVNVAASPENFYQLLASYNTNLSSLSYTDPTFQGFIHHNFKSNEQFQTGVPTSDGYVSIEQQWNTAPASGDFLTVFCEYSALLRIDQNGVYLLV